jgi:hypothetical protein
MDGNGASSSVLAPHRFLHSLSVCTALTARSLGFSVLTAMSDDALIKRYAAQERIDPNAVVAYTPVLLRAAAAFAVMLSLRLDASSDSALPHASPLAACSWRTLFLPLFIGDLVCLLLLLAALVAIVPYVRVLIALGRPRVGVSNPSALDLVAALVASIGQLLALGLAFGAHWRLRCAAGLVFVAVI